MSKLRILFQKQQYNDKLALRYILKTMCFGPLPQGLFIREKNVTYSAVRFLFLDANHVQHLKLNIILFLVQLCNNNVKFKFLTE